MNKTSGTPVLNWREVARWVEIWRPSLEGLFVERVFSPERSRFPDGYLKNEWALLLTDRHRELILDFSVRPRQPFVAAYPAKGLRPASRATQSVFALNLGKHLKGTKLMSIEALPRERSIWLKFSPGTSLLINLIPALPEALLLEKRDASWLVISRSRKLENGDPYQLPDGAQAPENLALRTELIENLTDTVSQALAQEAFDLRRRNLERELKDLRKQAQERLQQSTAAQREALKEPDYQRFGDLLKNSMGQVPPLLRRDTGDCRELYDYAIDQTIVVPCDAKLTPQAQLEKFYQLARRKHRRIQEAEIRQKSFQAKVLELENALNQLAKEPKWEELESLESRYLAGSLPAETNKKPGTSKKAAAWLGKSFQSQDRWAIWVGRSRDENLELTFKCARGNDLWLHVRGKPGAHAVIPIQPGKSVPLETLLDAATLVVYYSGGEKWGKTEVDYTFKKHVKRIKDSTEASYTHNKTLLIEVSAERLKRLLAQS